MDEKIHGRCMRCKENGREIVDPEIVTMKNGARAARGKCAVCDAGMYKILPKNV